MASSDVLTAAELREELAEMPDDAPVAYHAKGLFEYIKDVETMKPLEVSETTVALQPSHD